MKKLVLLIVSCLFLGGCKQAVNRDDNSLFKQYNEYVDKLDQAVEFQDSSDEFNIYLVVNNAENNNYRYDVIIDTPTINMYHLQAIVKVEGENNDNIPTLGVLENEVFSLIPGVVDKDKGLYKGVNLSGITAKSEFDVLVYLTFSLTEQSNVKEERYFKLYGNAS